MNDTVEGDFVALLSDNFDALTRHLDARMDALAHRIDSSLARLDRRQDDPLSEQQRKLNRLIETTTGLLNRVATIERDLIAMNAAKRPNAMRKRRVVAKKKRKS